MKARLAVGIVAGMAAILITVATSQADPNLTNIPPHRHYVKTPDGGLVEVGPRVCGNPQLQRAFNQFHNNVHAVSGSAIGPAAPGLHNFTGADLQAGGC
jgi:hypothetical protein